VALNNSRFLRIIPLLIIVWCFNLWAANVEVLDQELNENGQGYTVLRVSGSYYEMGYAHTSVLGDYIVEAIGQTKAKLGGNYDTTRNLIAASVWLPLESEDELDGMVDCLNTTHPTAAIDKLDLKMFNTLGDWQYACRSHTCWGRYVAAPVKTLSTRRLDFSTALPILNNHVLIAYDPNDATAKWVNLSWPGIVTVAQGINEYGTLVSLHDFQSFPADLSADRMSRLVVARYAITYITNDDMSTQLENVFAELQNYEIMTGGFINYYAPLGFGGVINSSPKAVGSDFYRLRTPQVVWHHGEAMVTTNQDTNGMYTPSDEDFGVDAYYNDETPKTHESHWHLVNPVAVNHGLSRLSVEYRGQLDMTIWADGRLDGIGRTPRLEYEWSELFNTDVKYGGGTGEPNDPYQIATAEDLMLLGDNPEDYDKHFIMTADIDLDPNLPGLKVFDRAVIAYDVNDADGDYQGTAFTGIFDGNGHTVLHLTMMGGDYLGLFGQLDFGAMVSNLGLEVVDVNGGDFGRTVGGLVGQNYGRITMSFCTGTVSSRFGTGGLVGKNWGNINNCNSSCSVSGWEQIGGLVGSNYGNILVSFSTGKVTADEDLGGLVGINWKEAQISACYNTGTVSGRMQVGGLVGSNGSIITMSYSTGAVVGAGYVGGLVGSGWAPASFSSFWDIQTSGQAISAGGIGFTTAEMQTATTFLEAGWDFVGETVNGTEDIWWIDEGNDYPRLWWEPRFEPNQMVVSGYVDITTVYQELEGFGASVNWWEGYLIAHPLKNLIYDCLFGQLGLDIYKLRNAYEIPNGDEYIINSGEIVSAAQLSLGHPIKIMITSFTPPAYLKSNSDTADGTLVGSARGGGYRYDMFAQWWLDSLAEYSTYGITADYISIQSNPDVQAGSVWDSCKFTPTETTDYAGYNVAFETVYQKLNSEMTIMPKMLAPETWGYYSPQEYIDALIEQNNVFGFGHRDGDFGDPDSFIQNMENFAAQYGHKPLFTMSFNNDEVSFNAAMNLAISIHNRMVYENLCSFILSDLFKGEEAGGGLVTIDNPWDEFNPGYAINPVYYAFKQYSAFTDPGWHRVEISIDSDELRACAFISPDEDQLSIIIINTSEISINLMLTLGNFIMENSVVYRTSENENAAYIGTFDNTEPLSLPAQSITTVNLVD